MEKCKFCNQELPEGCAFCPSCGRSVTEPAGPEAAEEAAVQMTEETAPAEETAQETPRKAAPGKIALAVAAVVVLLAVLIALIAAGVKGKNAGSEPAATDAAGVSTEETVPATIPADGNPDDATCKGSYTVTDQEAVAAMDTVVATVGGNQLTNAQLQVGYWSTVTGFLNSEQGYYMMMYGALDLAQPLDTQRSIVDENLTWQQLFLQQALNNWRINCAMAGEAEKAGVEMSVEEREYLDNMEAQLNTTAASYNMTLEELLRRNVGPAAGLKEFVEFQELYSRGSGYYAQQTANLVPTEEELEAYFDEHAEEYASEGVTKDSVFVNVRHVLLTPQGEQVDGQFTEEQWKTCENEAQAVLDAWMAGDKTEDSFAALANEKSQDPGSNNNGGLYEKVYLGQMVKPFEEWCFDESRQTGDTGLVKTDYGYHVMYFVSSQPQWRYYAEKEWLVDQSNQLVERIVEGYPMDVEYSKIALGYVNLTGE